METRSVVLYLYLTKLLGNRWERFQYDLSVRKEVQKTVYFLQEKFNISFDYTYNLYIYGPYSQSLSKEAFALSNDPNSAEISQNNELKDCSANKIGGLKALFYDGDTPDLDKMELAATAHFLYNYTFASGTPEERKAKCADHIKMIKPHFSINDITTSFDFLVQKELLDATRAR